MCAKEPKHASADLGHTSSQHSSNQLAGQVGSHHHQLHASTQVDGNSEGGVEMGATRGREAVEIRWETNANLQNIRLYTQIPLPDVIHDRHHHCNSQSVH